MSAPAHDAKHDDGAVHAHISSFPFYVGIFLALVALTVTTVGQSYVDLGKANLFVVILIATMKASLVVSFFMHLRWDNKFNALIFISCIFFIGVFFAYTMNDTDRRGELDPDQNVKVWEKTGEEAPGGFKGHPGPAGEEHGPNPSPTGEVNGAEHPAPRPTAEHH